jgi:hypothetical protein
VRARLTAPLGRELDAIAARVPPGSRVLQRALRRTRETVDRAAARLAERLAHAARERDHAAVERAARLADRLCPGGAPQERVWGFAALAAEVGPRRLIESIVRAIEPPAVAPQPVIL